MDCIAKLKEEQAWWKAREIYCRRKVQAHKLEIARLKDQLREEEKMEASLTKELNRAQTRIKEFDENKSLN